MDRTFDQSAELGSPEVWQQYLMAIDRVTQRMERIISALQAANIEHALVGGQAVALWVATRDPAAVRTTKDIDLLVRRDDLPRVRAAGLAAGFDYFEALGVGMLLDRADPNPRHAVHLIWAGEIARSGEKHPMPTLNSSQCWEGKWRAASVLDLVLMKLVANRDQDRVHLRDMIDVGLIDRKLCEQLPADLRTQLDLLMAEAGR
ncbi:MAG TPA: nucleotidyltransferase family protein [Pirellulales bacterium]|nr:nucleotidyltransferase family protein [Pirellulales bacterium]